MALTKIKKFFIAEDEEMDEELVDEELDVISSNKAASAYKNLNSKNSHLVLTEPRAYSESQSIADHIKEKRAVVVNLQRVTPDAAKRIIDFLSGTVYALDGDIQKIGGNIFLCTPNTVNVAGEISEDAEVRKW